MADQSFTYVIIGGGVAGMSAVAGIRERDKEGEVLLISAENHLPYERPPLSKQLWFGKARLADIYPHDQAYYKKQGVRLVLGTKAIKIDPARHTVTDANGASYQFEKLLLATGVLPRKLAIPGGELEDICHFRNLDDFLGVQQQIGTAKSVLVIGGGFIGSELAAALNLKLEVTWIFPGATLCNRVFPKSLGEELQRSYQMRGVRVLNSEMPVSISKGRSGFVTVTSSGKNIESDLVVVGIGTVPAVWLAQEAGLEIGDGILVNQYLQTSHPDIYAAGDNAFFPYAALGQKMRIEHWDNALSQGKLAGRNMADAQEAFTYQPYFFSDLFEFGYEATGEVNTKLETIVDWEKENVSGVIFYLADSRVRGVLLCNLWGKLDQARELIRQGRKHTPETLRGLIR
jgi:NADPH-dependent 2,4-dienoyl-CoA reductase/sulfur reductase-like enzyme